MTAQNQKFEQLVASIKAKLLASSLDSDWLVLNHFAFAKHFMARNPSKRSFSRSFVATCDNVGVIEKDGYELVYCPSAPDCLAAAIPVKPALTVSQAKELTSSAGRTQAPAMVATGSKSVHKDPDKK